MIISYNWLSEYLPLRVEPEKLSVILTSIGLEVESMESFDEVKGGLQGLVIGHVLETEKHPNADKLTLTKVDTGENVLQIVCGAPNVAAGQKVVVAPVGTTIYPTSGDPLTMKIAKIRSVESHGMICAEDEIGLGSSHAGIMVLPADAPVGQKASDYFKPYSDIVYHIGLTPNRADAMSHWGVARDVCAYLSHHEQKNILPNIPKSPAQPAAQNLNISVRIENEEACPRYSGVCFSGIQVKESPKWMQGRLKAIGLRPINNIVDITNYIQHETGQPLHAFDYDAIAEQKVIVKNLAEGTVFKTLDEKDRKLSAHDLMICSATKPMCIAGVFGGIESGVTEKTTNIFLESAFFDPATIRKTSFRHGLRTDAATRFEKGVDISNTVVVLKRAAQLISEITGGTIASEIIDHYPSPAKANEVELKYDYLKKLSGKKYEAATVKSILKSLGFGVEKEEKESITVSVPHHKRDISYPADIVEEIIRIDGLDNIEIPTAITITPSIDNNYREEQLKERISNGLAGLGFHEILTNSITNSKYFGEEQASLVKMINNLSSELDVMRPSMLPTALEVIAYNQNRKNADLKLFEFGKSYNSYEAGKYTEINHLCIYVTGNVETAQWKHKPVASDLFYVKGVVEMIFSIFGVSPSMQTSEDQSQLVAMIKKNKVAEIGRASAAEEKIFDLRQPVFYAILNWDLLIRLSAFNKIRYKEVSKFPAVERDLAVVVPRTMKYDEIEKNIQKLNLRKLQSISLFDVFESEKLGAGKKSMAVNFTFLDEEKTLTDKEIDSWMTRIMTSLESELGAEIRK